MQTGLFSNKSKAYMAIMLSHTFLVGTREKIRDLYGIDTTPERNRLYFASQRISGKMPKTFFRNLERHIVITLKRIEVTTFAPAEMIALTLNFLTLLEILVTEEMDKHASALISEVKSMLLVKFDAVVTSEMLQNTEAEADMYFRDLLEAI